MKRIVAACTLFIANPLAKGTPQEFVDAMRGAATVIVLKPGEKTEF